MRLQAQDSNEFFYYEGFPLGFVEDQLAYLNNHVDITIRYIYNEDNIKVVAFEVRPDRCAQLVFSQIRADSSCLSLACHTTSYHRRTRAAAARQTRAS